MESGANPEQPPLLYEERKANTTLTIFLGEGSLVGCLKSGDMPVCSRYILSEGR